MVISKFPSQIFYFKIIRVKLKTPGRLVIRFMAQYVLSFTSEFDKIIVEC